MKFRLSTLFLLVLITGLAFAWLNERRSRAKLEQLTKNRAKELESTYPYVILAEFSINRSHLIKHPLANPEKVNNRLLVQSLMHVFWKRDSIQKFKSLAHFESPDLLAGRLLYELDCKNFEEFHKCFIASEMGSYLPEYLNDESDKYRMLKKFVEQSILNFDDVDKMMQDGILEQHKSAR